MVHIRTGGCEVFVDRLRGGSYVRVFSETKSMVSREDGNPVRTESTSKSYQGQKSEENHKESRWRQFRKAAMEGLKRLGKAALKGLRAAAKALAAAGAVVVAGGAVTAGVTLLGMLVPLPVYEAKDERSGMSLIAMQPLVADQAFMPHIKAMYVPFHMAYSGLICSKGLQSDRPK